MLISSYPESGSKDFNEFMDFIGDKTKLKGYKGYKAGLDVERSGPTLHATKPKSESSLSQIIPLVHTLTHQNMEDLK